MLVDLKVKNFAIIEGLDIEFEAGLNIISGETGSGKSVLLKSLALLMGEKALADTVRSGAQNAVIEGYFDLSNRPDVIESLENMGITCEDQVLVVRRMVSAQGKSKVFVNGTLSAVSSLRDVVCPLITVTGHTAPLIEMTGQHENRNLQSKAYHLDILDRYAGCWERRQKVAELYARRSEIGKTMSEIREQTRSREQRLDFLRFQQQEIQSLSLKPGEETDLESRYSKAKNFSKLAEFADMTEVSLYSAEDSVLVRLHHILHRAQELGRLDSGLLEKTAPLSHAKSLIEDAVYELRHYAKNSDADPALLDQLEERLSALRKLQKKYGGSVDEILKQLQDIETEISQLESSDSQLEELEQELQQIESQLMVLCEDLHKRRSSGAHLLEKGVNEELADLNMKGVKFVVQVQVLSEVTTTGTSDVEFLIQNSKQDEARPMARVASGGELSRILLSLKRVVGVSDQPRTYLFDEVDAGVSGLTAEKVGHKLKSIAKGQQVICVTHLPQVAACADRHLIIEKSATKAGVRLSVSALNKSERVKEIARLISGEKITQTSLDHAKQLLQDSP